MSRGSASKTGANEADFNPIGQNLANKFMQSRNQTNVDSRYDMEKLSTVNQSYDRSSRRSSGGSTPSDRNEKDLWAAGGEHLSTNKLSLMLSDMQGRLKDLPTPDASDDGLPWRSPSTDSLDASELGSVLFGQLRTGNSSPSPSIFNYSDNGSSPGPAREHKRVRQFRRTNSEDDNESLSSVSTTSTTSYQRSRRTSGLTKPSYSFSNHEANGKQSFGMGRRRFGDLDSDYISDGASVTSAESGVKSAKSQKSQKSHNSQRLGDNGAAPLTRLQQQQLLMQQMRPMTGQGTTASPPAAETVSPRTDTSRSSTGRTSPLRARPGSTEQPTSSSAATAPSNGKTRSTTPTGIPRGMPGASTPLRTAADEPSTSRSPAPASSRPLRTVPDAEETIKLTAPASSVPPGTSSTRAQPHAQRYDGPVKMDPAVLRDNPVQEVAAAPARGSLSPRSPETAQAQPAAAKPATPAATSSSAPAAASGPASARSQRPSDTTPSGESKKGSPPQSAARKFEMVEDMMYPERGRLRIRSASNARASGVESLGRSASVDAAIKNPRAVELAAAAERERARAQQRSASVTRSDPTAGMIKATGGASAPLNRTVSESAAATYRSPPAKGARNGTAVTPNDAQKKGTRPSAATVPAPGSAGRSPVTPALSKSAPAVKQTKTSLRRQSEGSAPSAAKEITPKKTAQPRERRFSLPTATTPITPPQMTKASPPQRTPAKINTNVVSVPTPARGLTPNRTSSSSLSTQGSGSASNSRSSTPTSTGGRSGGSRASRTPSSRQRGTLTPVQLKSQNPYPLRNSLSPRRSLDGSPNTPLQRSPSPTRAQSTGRIRAPARSAANHYSPAADPSSPTTGESDYESAFSSVPQAPVSRFFQPPPDAVPYAPNPNPLRFMMSMAHLGQESISGVYDSANYSPGPRYLAKNKAITPKYVMRGAEAQIAQIKASERQPESPKDDNDQGSGNTETTKASSYDSGDYGGEYSPGVYGSSHGLRPTGPVRMSIGGDK